MNSLIEIETDSVTSSGLDMGARFYYKTSIIRYGARQEYILAVTSFVVPCLETAPVKYRLRVKIAETNTYYCGVPVVTGRQGYL